MSYRFDFRFSRLTLFALFPLSAFFALTWNSVVAQSVPIQVLDDQGQSVQLAQPAKRVITLAPNLAELVVAAGGQARLVGVSSNTDFPQALTQLPVVGDAFGFNLERMAALKPDLIVAWQSGASQRQLEALKKLKVPIFISEVRDIEDMAKTISRIGVLLGSQQAASDSVQHLRAQTKQFEQQFAKARQKPVRVFFQVWDRPLMTLGGNHLVTQLLQQCGAVQGFNAIQHPSPTVNLEAVVAFNPQVILTGGARRELDLWQKHPQVAAVKNKHLYAVDGIRLTRMSPRVLTAAQSTCSLIDNVR